MAGNVKEWCLNAAGQKRYILGGAWNEPVYMFTDADAQSPFERNANYGFRCMKVDAMAALSPPLTSVVNLPSRDPRAARAVSDAVFEAYRSLYSFDHGNLDAKVDAVDDSSPEWRVEKVSYAAAYADERIPAYLYLPKGVKPPYQTLVVFPGSGVISQRSSAGHSDVDRFNFVMRSGRALLYPIYKSTYERGDAITSDYPNSSSVYRDHVIMWSKDVGRSVDYLESRPDIAKDKIGYLGFSWGAELGPTCVATEPRLSLAIFVVGGLSLQPALPEADQINFAPRVKVPVLMLNGRYDFFFPTETSQEPLFGLLGSPPADKRRVVYETGHNLPTNSAVQETLNWFDRYLGPIR
jgi:cephalosporin-C deacetylase-like acetyl esterase